jgi:hypothetical protein
MKKLITILGAAALLAGCASHDNNNDGMGGSGEDTMKTDSIHNSGNGGSQFNNNATQGTGSSTATNSGTITPDTSNTTGTPQ